MRGCARDAAEAGVPRLRDSLCGATASPFRQGALQHPSHKLTITDSMQYAYNWGMTATSRFTVADRRAANLVGAFALTLVDRLYEAAEQVVGGSTASAALTTLLTYRGIFAVTSI